MTRMSQQQNKIVSFHEAGALMTASGADPRICERGGGGPSCSLSLPFPFRSPSPRSRAPLNQLEGLGERCKLLQWGQNSAFSNMTMSDGVESIAQRGSGSRLGHPLNPPLTIDDVVPVTTSIKKA